MRLSWPRYLWISKKEKKNGSSLNWFIADKAMLKFGGREGGLDFEGKWKIIGRYYLKIEKWSRGKAFNT